MKIKKYYIILNKKKKSSTASGILSHKEENIRA